MNQRDRMAIFTLLLTGPSMSFYEGEIIPVKEHVPTLLDAIFTDCSFINIVLEYLKNLKLSYSFVRDILNDNYGSVFYHKEMGMNSDPLPENYDKEKLYTSEHDGQIWITDEGRIGVWCEVDGFVAWLDEYKKVWIVDSRKEVRIRRKESEKVWNEFWQKEFEKIYTPSVLEEVKSAVEVLEPKKIKIASFKPDLPTYNREEPLCWEKFTPVKIRKIRKSKKKKKGKK